MQSKASTSVVEKNPEAVQEETLPHDNWVLWRVSSKKAHWECLETLGFGIMIKNSVKLEHFEFRSRFVLLAESVLEGKVIYSEGFALQRGIERIENVSI